MPQGAICSGALGKMAPLIITARKGHNTRTAAGEKVPVDICCPPEGYNTRTAAGEKVPVPSWGAQELEPAVQELKALSCPRPQIFNALCNNLQELSSWWHPDPARVPCCRQDVVPGAIVKGHQCPKAPFAAGLLERWRH